MSGVGDQSLVNVGFGCRWKLGLRTDAVGCYIHFCVLSADEEVSSSDLFQSLTKTILKLGIIPDQTDDHDSLKP